VTPQLRVRRSLVDQDEWTPRQLMVMKLNMRCSMPFHSGESDL
jgi:hypothetical protein